MMQRNGGDYETFEAYMETYVGLLREDAPVRHDAKRRRLKTVMQELMYVAARVVESGRRLALKFSHRCPAFPSFEAVYAKLAPA